MHAFLLLLILDVDMKKYCLLICVFFLINGIQATEQRQRNCIVLQDQHDQESVGAPNWWFLTSRLQSAIAEQSTPMIVSTSLLTSFLERRLSFKQSLEQKDSLLCKTHALYQSINNRMQFWSEYYGSKSHDLLQNKNLVVQRINKEFYKPEKYVTPQDYQLLLDYYTSFDLEDWKIYKDGRGFYLLIPKKYSEKYSISGFKTEGLQEVVCLDDVSSLYFDYLDKGPLLTSLLDFFMPQEDFLEGEMPFAWNIMFAGHGGNFYGETLIANSSVKEFKEILAFFNSHVNTHLFHYSTCYGGGHHLSLAFDDGEFEPYNYAIMCGNLTDCVVHCKWVTRLPSTEKPFLNADDVVYDSEKKCWQLPFAPVYEWETFFNALTGIDFSISSIDQLNEIMPLVTYTPLISNMPLLCLPGTSTFFPLLTPDVMKIDEQFLNLAEEDETIILNQVSAILVESSLIKPTITIDNTEDFRVISIAPKKAVHHFHRLTASHHIDLPSTFWQAEYQLYDKIFVLDECVFPNACHSVIFNHLPVEDDALVLKNMIIVQYSYKYMRIFFTINDVAMMVVANKPGLAEDDPNATVQEIVILTPQAQEKYNEYYKKLTES